MFPSEVRQRILEDHVVIRAGLRDLVTLILRAECGDRLAANQLCVRARRFLEFFLEHIERENAILVPALKDADAWGEERARRVLDEHEEQAKEVKALLEAIADPYVGARELAELVERFTAELEIDMESEERTSLAADLLRDDVVGIDVEAG